jgi:ATP-dependent DNA ligase
MPGQAAGDNPGFIAPMLATAAAGLPPCADEFMAEVKWDGLRACVAVAGGRVRAWSSERSWSLPSCSQTHTRP